MNSKREEDMVALLEMAGGSASVAGSTAEEMALYKNEGVIQDAVVSTRTSKLRSNKSQA
jgi:hypothetical protein